MSKTLPFIQWIIFWVNYHCEYSSYALSIVLLSCIKVLTNRLWLAPSVSKKMLLTLRFPLHISLLYTTPTHALKSRALVKYSKSHIFESINWTFLINISRKCLTLDTYNCVFTNPISRYTFLEKYSCCRSRLLLCLANQMPIPPLQSFYILLQVLRYLNQHQLVCCRIFYASS